jgi:hypothetical protein
MKQIALGVLLAIIPITAFFVGLQLGWWLKKRQIRQIQQNNREPEQSNDFVKRGTPIKLAFDHEPTDDEIRKAIDAIDASMQQFVNDITSKHTSPHATIKHEFEQSKIFQELKNLDQQQPNHNDGHETPKNQ